jgi:tetratricopeptide (TPR) repeat protein
VLYQLTVGRVPFNADTPFSIIHDHIYTPLPMPRETHPEMSELLENVLLKALAKDRRDRFATVDDLVRAFEAAFTGKTVRPPAQVTTVAAGGASRDEVANSRFAAGGAVQADAARPAVAPALLPSGRAPAPRPQPGAAATRAPARRRWPWVLGGLGLSSLCLLTFAVAASQELRTVPTTPSGAATPGPASVAPASVAPSESPPEPDAVQAAQAAVDGRPEDPQARLELAKTLEAAGQFPQANLEFTKAGELFLQQGTYTRAADALLAAARLQQQRGTQDPRLAELLTQALFLGAPTGEILPWVQSAAGLSPPYPGLDALEARARLYMGERDRARQLLEKILAERPEDLLAGAVMVDLLHTEGKTPEAIAQADRILARPRLPDWLTKHLNGLKASMVAP